ncbi:hypothetical protein [Lysobacter sp. HA35]
MTLQIDHRITLFSPGALVGSSRGYLGAVYPLGDGSVVVHLAECVDDNWSTLLLHAGPDFRRELAVPSAVRERVEDLRRDPVTESATWGAPISFKVGERIGLLVTDRCAWVFDPVGGEEPVEIAIKPLALANCINAPRSFMPVRAGLSCDHRVPVIFRHPDGRDDYPCYLSTLEIDLQRRTGHWTLRAADGQPVTVPYRVDLDDFNGTDAYAGTTLGDVVWLGDRFRIFTMGNRTHYGRMGMSHAAVVDTDPDGTNPRCVREMDESCHGLFSADGRRMLLLPFFKSGARKGKPSILDLEDGTETGIAVRGLATYRPLADRDGVVWLAGKGSWSDWSALVLDAGGAGEIVGCRVGR